MENLIKWIGKKVVKALAIFFAFLEQLKIYSFPDGFGVFRKFSKAINLLISNYTDITTNRYIRDGAANKIVDEGSKIWSDPFLRFQAIWSIGNGSVNTPCPVMLSTDLASLVDLGGKKILCIGSKNHYETNLLVLKGADRRLITNVDLYSNIPGILPMDFHNLEFPDESFDIVFWAGSYAYATDLQRAASQAVRVVKKPGIVAVGDSLMGDVTRETLLSGQPGVKDALAQVSDDVEVFTKGLGTIEQMTNYFLDGSTKEANVLLTRKYLPSHANVIISYR
ncbi:MAG: methyltransferase domain-containing protein [Pseudomonadota bacterium]